MKWRILYAIERWEDLEANNINDAADKAKENKREGERIVRIGIGGY